MLSDYGRVRRRLSLVKMDLIGVLKEAIESGMGIDRIADDLVPFADQDLAGQDQRVAAVEFFRDLVDIETSPGIE